MEVTEEHQYIVSFLPGTSGKFICSIIWKMLTESNTVTPYTEQNSAHVDYSWWGKWNTEDNKEYPNTDDIFNGLRIRNNGILPTHTFPNFDVIRTDIPTAKIILILSDFDSLHEIAHNWVYKNNDQDLEYWLKRVTDGLIEGSTDKEKSLMYVWEFFNTTTVPDDFIDKTLLVTYKSMFEKNPDGSFVFLNRLSEFIGKPITSAAEASYRNYVESRNKEWNK